MGGSIKDSGRKDKAQVECSSANQGALASPSERWMATSGAGQKNTQNLTAGQFIRKQSGNGGLTMPVREAINICGTVTAVSSGSNEQPVSFIDLNIAGESQLPREWGDKQGRKITMGGKGLTEKRVAPELGIERIQLVRNHPDSIIVT
jgi:hypothetical protein